MDQKKEELQPAYTLTDRLYFGEFAIYKRTITSNFKHPILGKNACHKFHIGTLEQYKDPKQFNKRLKDFGHMIDKTDRTEELRLFNVPLKDRQNYFFFEVWDGKKKLPLYYASIYTRDCFDTGKNSAWSDYTQNCQRELSYYIYEETIHSSCMLDLFGFFHKYGFDFFEQLGVRHPAFSNEPHEPMEAGWLNHCRRKFGKMKEPAMRNYALAVLDSVFQKARRDHEVMQCQFCGSYIDYIKNKRFCSLLSEKRDCGKKARNKRYYDQKGRQRLPIYRKASKELRAFYKSKNVKK